MHGRAILLGAQYFPVPYVPEASAKDYLSRPPSLRWNVARSAANALTIAGKPAISSRDCRAHLGFIEVPCRLILWWFPCYQPTILAALL